MEESRFPKGNYNTKERKEKEDDPGNGENKEAGTDNNSQTVE